MPDAKPYPSDHLDQAADLITEYLFNSKAKEVRFLSQCRVGHKILQLGDQEIHLEVIARISTTPLPKGSA